MCDGVMVCVFGCGCEEKIDLFDGVVDGMRCDGGE